MTKLIRTPVTPLIFEDLSEVDRAEVVATASANGTSEQEELNNRAEAVGELIDRGLAGAFGQTYLKLVNYTFNKLFEPEGENRG